MSEDLQALAKTLSLHEGVEVLEAHPSGLIALNKPDGVLSHPNKHEDRNRSLINGHYDYDERRFSDLEGPGSVEEVYLVNRLDSATSGVILVCTNAEMMTQIIRAFEKGRVKKSYQAIVQGKPNARPSIWTDRMSVMPGPGRGRRAQGGGNLLARTEQRTIKMDANQLGLALVNLIPITGRTHQLRYQLTMRGHPILGDANYGDFNLNHHFAKLSFARRLFLHSCSIELPLIIGGQKVEFYAESPLPSEFEMILSPNKEAKALSRFAPSRRAIAAAQRKRFSREAPRF